MGRGAVRGRAGSGEEEVHEERRESVHSSNQPTIPSSIRSMTIRFLRYSLQRASSLWRTKRSCEHKPLLCWQPYLNQRHKGLVFRFEVFVVVLEQTDERFSVKQSDRFTGR